MKYLVFLFLLFIAASGFSQQPGWIWANGFGGTNGPEKAVDAVTDSNGFIYIVGTFESQSMICGPTVLNNNGQVDFILVKFSPQGSIMWALSFGNTNHDIVSGICVDNMNNIFISGYFKSQSISIGSTQLLSSGDDDMFISKISSGGQVLWAKSIGGSGSDQANSITCDQSGNIYFTGNFSSSTLEFDSATVHRSVGLSDIFIAKYTSGGDLVWVESSEFDVNTSLAEANDIVMDNANNICIGGSFSDNVYGAGGGTYIRFGSNIVTNKHTYTWSVYTDYYPTALLAKFDSDGNYISAYSDSAYYEALSIVADQNNNIYASFFIEGGIMISLPYGAFSIVQVNPAMELTWRKKPEGGGYNVCSDLAVDINNHIYASGFLSSPQMYFQYDTLTIDVFGGHHYYEMFVLKFDSYGDELWVRNFGGKLSDYASCILPIDQESLYLIGSHESDSMFLGDKLLRNLSDTGSYHVHVMPDWRWRHPNIFIGKYSENFSAISGSGEAIHFKTYPNPAKQLLSIEGKDIQEVRLLNIKGQTMLKMNNDGKENLIQLQLGKYSPGIYIVKIITSKGSSSRKVVIN